MERGLIKISIGYIHYRATGQGKPIILLHATGGSSDMYLKFMPVLGRKLRVFALDTPSFGCSDHIPGPPGTYAISDYARWVIEVMDGLGVEKASFIGIATGAYISIELANAYPERVEKLAISPPFWDEETGRKILSGHVANRDYPEDASGFPLTQTLDFVREKMPDAGHPTQAWMDMHNLGLIQAGRDLWQAAGGVAKYDLRSNAKRLQCPVLLIWGEYYLSHRQARYVQVRDEFASLFKNRQVAIIKDAMSDFFWERPEEVGKVVLEFLA